jgi:hypothetical protein
MARQKLGLLGLLGLGLLGLLERTSHENIVFQNLVQILHTAWVLIPQ